MIDVHSMEDRVRTVVITETDTNKNPSCLFAEAVEILEETKGILMCVEYTVDEAGMQLILHISVGAD